MKRPLNLADVATRAMLDNHFLVEFDPALLVQPPTPADFDDPSIVDETDVLWSSMDNEESQDLDQLEWAEDLSGKRIRLKVAIADVDAWVAKNCPVDKHAAYNSSSIYTGVITFPMLPLLYSANLTSLLPDVIRLAIVVDMIFDADGKVLKTRIYRAKVKNHCKLVYDDVNRWYSEGAAYPALEAVPGLADQVRLQFELGQRLAKRSKAAGALDFNTIEATPQTRDGEVVDLKVTKPNIARDLVKLYMVTTNSAMAQYLESKNVAFVRRTVKTPEKWGRIVEVARQHGTKLPATPNAHALADFLEAEQRRDPDTFPDLSLSIVKLLGKGEYVVSVPGGDADGHFGLGQHDYTHFTAPNRRYIDLVLQRILKSVIKGGAPAYTPAELQKITEQCMKQEHGERKISRLVRKVAAALLLRNRIGEVFEGIVTGVTDKGTFVRVISPPAEGRLVKGQKNIDVADKIKVKLVSVSVEKGFLDFEQVGRPVRKIKG